MVTTIADTRLKIASMAGRARVRVVMPADVTQVLREAHVSGYGNRAGGTVANCYNYPASRMRLSAVRGHDGNYYVFADWGNAKKSTSSIPEPLPRQYRLNEIAYTAKLQDTAPKLAEHAIAILPASEIRRLLSEDRQRAKDKILWTHPQAQVIVTTEDSLRAGNCRAETDRVQKAIGKTQITAPALRKWITRHQPHLAPYANKAIEAALA